MKNKRGWILITIGLLVPSVWVGSSMQRDMNAQIEKTIEQDTIVDIEAGTYGRTNYAITDKGEVYAWGENYEGQFGDGTIFPGTDTGKRDNNPRKVLNYEGATDGNTYLSGVKNMCGGGEFRSDKRTMNGYAIALKEDGTVYGWGNNTAYSLGISGAAYADNFLIPKKLPVDFEVQSVHCSYSYENPVTILISKDGQPYIAGKAISGGAKKGQLGLGPGVLEATTFTKIKQEDGSDLPRIKDVAISNLSTTLLSENGEVYTMGVKEILGIGTPATEDFLTATDSIWYPTKAKFAADRDVSGIASLHTGSTHARIILKGDDGTLYYNADVRNRPLPGESKPSDANTSGYYEEYKLLVKVKNATTGVMEYKDASTVLPYGSTNQLNTTNSGLIFIGDDGKLYGQEGNFDVDLVNSISQLSYSFGDVNASFATAKKGIGGYRGKNDMLVLSNDGAVYDRGVKRSFFSIEGRKQDRSGYASEEKYNGDITLKLLLNATNASDLSLQKTDLTTGGTQTISSIEQSIAISLPEDTRIYESYEYTLPFVEKTYTIVSGSEVVTEKNETYKRKIVIDLYKKSFPLDDLTEGATYDKGKTVNFPLTNGFAENVISATLKKGDGEKIPYVSGTPITEHGVYVLEVKDMYGNGHTIQFYISEIASINLAKVSTGELIYGNTITQKNNIAGTLTLAYKNDTDSGEIKEVKLGATGDVANFEIVETNKLKVVNEDLIPDKEYVIPVSGTDTNDVPFAGEVKFQIARITQTMEWDDDTAKLAVDGLVYGDDITLGVKNKIGDGVQVAYTLETEQACVSITPENKVSITCIPTDAITILATPSGNDKYSETPLKLTVQIIEKYVTLDVVMKDEDDTYKQELIRTLGSSLPTLQVQKATSDTSFVDITSLGTPTYTFKKDGVVVQNPMVTSGVYEVSATYPAGSLGTNYEVTWNNATLRVVDIVIDEANMADYFTIESNHEPYTLGTWTNQPIQITPIHATFTQMKINGGTASTAVQTYQDEGKKEVELEFSSVDGAKASITVNLQYDKTAPSKPTFTYHSVHAPVRSVLRSIFSFTDYFDEEKEVRFQSDDEKNGSGVSSYTYRIVEVTNEGIEIAGTQKTGNVTEAQGIKLLMNKNYKISAKANDHAGNESVEENASVQLNNEVGTVELTATSKGKPYDGSTWTTEAINVQLQGTNASGVKTYQYSEDGTTYKDVTSSDGTITLPSTLKNMNKEIYTFRAVNQDGSNNETTLQMNIDKDKPVIKVKGMIGNTEYEGQVTNQEVSIIPYQEEENISGITYYYTTKQGSANEHPLTDSNWTVYNGSLNHTKNGETTYYFKGISGAGLQSEVEEIQVRIDKKVYTEIDVKTISKGTPYTAGTWTNGQVTFEVAGGLEDTTQIDGYEVCETKSEQSTSTCDWKAMQSNTMTVTTSKESTYWFRVQPVDPKGKLSKGTSVKIDVDAPTRPSFTIEPINTSVVAKFMNMLSFGTWMKEGVKVTMTSSDTGAGLSHYTYKEIDEQGKQIAKTSQDGIVTYTADTNIYLKAVAYDHAGNVSKESDESGKILIDTKAPIIEGVKDQGEYKQYYVPRFVSVFDHGSGIKTATYTRNDGEKSEMNHTKHMFKNTSERDEVYVLNVEDHAGHTTMLTFKLVPLPNIETEIDGSDESQDIIAQIQKEYNENKDEFDEVQRQEYETWIKEAQEKWEESRKNRVEHSDTGSAIEGIEGNTFEPNTELIVQQLKEEEIPVLPRKAIGIYDVYLKKGNTVIQANGSVKVYLPYAEAAEPIVFAINKQGDVREIEATREGNFVVFVTTTLETYAISNQNQEEIKEPSYCVVGPDDQADTNDDVCGSGYEDEKPQINPDGSITIPPNGSVTFPNGEQVELPEGGILQPNGTVILPNGDIYDADGTFIPKEVEQEPNEDTSYCVVGEDGIANTDDDVCAFGNGEEGLKRNPNGSIQIPNGGRVEFPNGIILQTPDGAILLPDGTVILPNGDRYDANGNKINASKEQSEILSGAETGDTRNLQMWLMLCISLLTMGFYGFFRRKICK